MFTPGPVSRRRFLHLAAGASTAALLGACGASSPQAPQIGGGSGSAAPVASTGGTSVGGTIYTLADKTWVDVGMLEATKQYNAARPGGT